MDFRDLPVDLPSRGAPAGSKARAGEWDRASKTCSIPDVIADAPPGRETSRVSSAGRTRRANAGNGSLFLILLPGTFQRALRQRVERASSRFVDSPGATMEFTMKFTTVAMLAALLLSGGVAIAQSSSGSSSSSSGTGAGSAGSPSTANPSTSNPSATSPSTSPTGRPSTTAPLDPGNSSMSGPNAQSNTYAPGTVGQAPSVNPSNPQDRTRLNPQDLNSPTGRNPQDLSAPSSAPRILQEERR